MDSIFRAKPFSKRNVLGPTPIKIANGNLKSGDGKSIDYNAFNKPVRIEKNNVVSLFSYGANQMRYKHVKQGKAGGNETTHYIDKAYEVIMHNGTVIRKAYLGDAIISEKETNMDSTFSIGFVHRDRLGSVVTITDENGNVVDNKSYDPFGKPRKGSMERVDPDNKPTLSRIAWLEGFSSVESDVSLVTRRGFTDHEHLDDAELIHMNGRVYDYNLGRFLSVDPFIQEPGNSQSMNPYSYIMNNPLAGTDPSGYSSIPTNRSVDTIQINNGFTFTMTATVNGKETTISINTKKDVDPSDINKLKLKDVNSIQVGNISDGANFVKLITHTGGTRNKLGTASSLLEKKKVDFSRVDPIALAEAQAKLEEWDKRTTVSIAGVGDSYEDAVEDSSQMFVPAATLAKREVQWDIIRLADGTYGYTFPHVGEEGATQNFGPNRGITRKLSAGLDIIHAMHSHFDKNTKLSVPDGLYVAGKHKKGYPSSLGLVDRNGVVTLLDIGKVNRHFGRGRNFDPNAGYVSGKPMNITIDINYKRDN